MSDSPLATQERDLGIGAHLRDESHAPMGAYGCAVMYCAARSLLSPMLQGIEGIINGLSHIIARLMQRDSNNAAGIVQLFASSNPPFSSTWRFATLTNDQIRI